MREISQQEINMVSGRGEDIPTVVISYPHEELHSPGWMGQVEMFVEWLMGGAVKNLTKEEFNMVQ